MIPGWKRRLAIAAALLSAACASAHAEPPGADDLPRAPVKPRASEILPRAAQRLLLDVVNNGVHLVAVGERGHILASNDGLHWAQVAVPVRSTLTALTFVDGQTGYAVGHDATILRTDDGGKRWQLQNFEPQKDNALLDVLFVDRNHGYAVGAVGSFYATADGGANWAAVDAPAVRSAELYFHAITRLGDGSLLIAGETGMLGLSSPDRRKWTRLKAPFDGSFFGALPHGARGAIVFGPRGKVFVTDDVRGKRWRPVATDSQASWFGGTVLPDGRAALVGSGGEVRLVDAAGKRAEPLPSGVTFALAGVAPYGAALVLVGENGSAQIALPPR